MKPPALCSILLLSLLACTAEEDPPDAPPAIDSTPAMTPLTPTTLGADVESTYTITGLDDRQAYRITLVHGDNLTTAGDGTGTFVDNDNNGAADAGPSETVGLITQINTQGYVPGFKTVPGTTDDPANPSGIYPTDGQFVVTVLSIGSGTLYPVVYHNEGASTFLEIDATGVPIEPYAVGGAFTVEGPPVGPLIDPDQAQSTAVDGQIDYTITGLDDLYAYRITLVHTDNLTPGLDQTGTFIDLDVNGAADAGPSEEVALIYQVNGLDAVPNSKTVPAGDDDPAAPTGVFPIAGEIVVGLIGVGEGTVYPVAYRNGGASTFLEIDGTGAPIEEYAVGGALTVTPAEM